jgi:hypothetical protein
VGQTHVGRAPHRGRGQQARPPVCVAAAPGALMYQNDVRARYLVEAGGLGA